MDIENPFEIVLKSTPFKVFKKNLNLFVAHHLANGTRYAKLHNKQIKRV